MAEPSTGDFTANSGPSWTGSANSALEGGELVCSCGGVASGAAVPASAPTGLLSASRRKSELLKSRRPTRDLNLKSEVSATFLTKKA